jgi:hypothetical protein
MPEVISSARRSGVAGCFLDHDLAGAPVHHDEIDERAADVYRYTNAR